MNYTIGQIQDLYDYLNFNVKNNYIDESIANYLIENQDWEGISKIRDIADSYEPDYDSNKPEEAGSERGDFVL